MMRMTKNKDDVETSLDEQRSSPKAGAPASGGGISRSSDGDISRQRRQHQRQNQPAEEASVGAATAVDFSSK